MLRLIVGAWQTPHQIVKWVEHCPVPGPALAQWLPESPSLSTINFGSFLTLDFSVLRILNC